MSADDRASGAGKEMPGAGGSISPRDKAEFERRSSELGRRLDEVKGVRDKAATPRQREAAMGQAFKMAIELVAGVGVGLGIGWAVDSAFATKPLFMIVFLILGFAAGMLNLIRTARRLQAAAEPLQRSAPSVRDDETDDNDARR